MRDGMEPRSFEIFPSGEIGIVWEDGEESYLPARPLRCACRCAVCVDEMTGRKLLDDARVPQDVRPVRAAPVGRYGLSIAWSDGHATGIYPWSGLREQGRTGPDLPAG